MRQAPGVSGSVLDVRGRDGSNLDTRASFLLPFEVVERLASDRSARRLRPRRWRQVTRTLLSEATPSWQSLRTPLRARISLLPFQLEPALAVTSAMASRILIADEVGLGKTIQAALIIAEALERMPGARVLIVAPAALKEQWQSELQNRFRIDAWLADSTSLIRFGAAWTTLNPWVGRPVTITSVDFVKRPEVMRSVEALVWDAVVFDEAHGLTGHSDRALAAVTLARRARTLILLTATPHSGDDRAFQSLCSIGDLDNRFALLTFRRTRRDVGLSVSRRTTTLPVQPTLAEREMHGALETYARRVRNQHSHASDAAHLAMTVLSRRACSSASSLACSIERRLELLPSDGSSAASQMLLPLLGPSADDEPGAELSAPGLDDRAEERVCLQRILLLARRAQAGESKVRVLTRLLRRAGEPAIVFTEYRDTLARLALELAHLQPVTLHGGLTAVERRDSLRRFTTGAASLLLATDAASEGLNLQQRCRLVINLELPWTPLRLEQRIGRVERIGQLRRVHAVHLLGSGTAEESHVAKLLMRTDRASDALEQLQSQHVPQLREWAITETARLEEWRRISDSRRGIAATHTRPPVTILRRRRMAHGILWAFHLSFSDSSSQMVWHTLLGVLTSHPADPIGLYESLDAAATHIAARLGENLERAQVNLERSLRQYMDLATRRERAIAQTLQAERGRLSTVLLQRGLFDRRSDRAFMAQSAVLDDALGRCRTRLDEIAATAQIVFEPARLAFVLIHR
jgi:superfamily II DNA or RNA helicase